MIRIWPFRRRATASDAARTLSQMAATERTRKAAAHKQHVRETALGMARKHGVAKAVEVLSRG
jgi:hypothetical protein